MLFLIWREITPVKNFEFLAMQYNIFMPKYQNKFELSSFAIEMTFKKNNFSI